MLLFTTFCDAIACWILSSASEFFSFLWSRTNVFHALAFPKYTKEQKLALFLTSVSLAPYCFLHLLQVSVSLRSRSLLNVSATADNFTMILFLIESEFKCWCLQMCNLLVPMKTKMPALCTRDRIDNASWVAEDASSPKTRNVVIKTRLQSTLFRRFIHVQTLSTLTNGHSFKMERSWVRVTPFPCSRRHRTQITHEKHASFALRGKKGVFMFFSKFLLPDTERVLSHMVFLFFFGLSISSSDEHSWINNCVSGWLETALDTGWYTIALRVGKITSGVVGELGMKPVVWEKPGTQEGSLERTTGDKVMSSG